MIPVFRPYGTQAELDAVSRVILSDYWGSGPECILFEDEFARYLNVKHCLATNSCTSALMLAGKLLNYPKNSEIIIPAITWLSSAFIAVHNGYIPIFADINEYDLNIDVDDIERKITKKTKAILVMHHGGYACDMSRIQNVARAYGLDIIEDCAHSLGGMYNDQHLGTFGDISCFSFQAVKNISTGDGGMIVIKNGEAVARAKSLRWLGLNIDMNQRHSSGGWQHDMLELGYKFQMNDILAALGRTQLKRIDVMNSRRKILTERYNNAFKDLPLKIKMPTEYQSPSYHFYIVSTKYRDDLRDYLLERNIQSSIHYKPLYNYTYFKKYKNDCPIADKVWKNILTIPLYACLTDDDQGHVIDCISSFFKYKSGSQLND